MPRIAGVDVPANKAAKVALRYVYGVGPRTAQLILKEAAIDPDVKARDITDEEVARLNSVIDRS